MKKVSIFALIVFVIATVNNALADNVRGINIDFVNIGNATIPTIPGTPYNGTNLSD